MSHKGELKSGKSRGAVCPETELGNFWKSGRGEKNYFRFNHLFVSPIERLKFDCFGWLLQHSDVY